MHDPISRFRVSESQNGVSGSGDAREYDLAAFTFVAVDQRASLQNAQHVSVADKASSPSSFLDLAGL
ncbi:hypothetical protein N7528_005762 [Penicillium herquei]|nr:hypothetical protein N7528_005762 [Penicillium herquei]